MTLRGHSLSLITGRLELTRLPAGTGQGNLAKPNGLICSVFRPSDDGTIFPYLIPSNFFAVVSLRQLAELVTAHYAEPAFAAECTALADEVHAALRAQATVEHPVFREILAYEIDGFGGRYLADDANVPSLLSLPCLDALAPEDLPLYQRTRRFLLSPEGNPYYAVEGVSGPHVVRDMIWPMGIILRAMTSTDEAEIARSIHFLKPPTPAPASCTRLSTRTTPPSSPANGSPGPTPSSASSSSTSSPPARACSPEPADAPE